MDPLDAMDQRILGSLLEKQVTVPATYPLTLNGLRTACNQTNSRDPVSAYDSREIELRCRELKDRGWLRVVPAGRVLKYHQLVDERLSLDAAQRALVTVLLLRGACSPGELKTRTERLHQFADRDAVETVLANLSARDEPVVRQLPRRAGQQDRRWIHLLGPVPDVAPNAVAPQVDREGVLREGAPARDARVREAYDRVAQAFAEHREAGPELPFDRWLLQRLAVEASGPVLDVGTGSGSVAASLAEAGADVVGLDISERMVAEARHRHPSVTFEVGDLRAVMRPATARGWALITGWYALVHLAESELAPAVAALARVLDDEGTLALALHVGDEVRQVTQLWDETVDIEYVFHSRDAVLAAVRAAGLTEIEWYERSPLATEPDTIRLYVIARRG